MTIKRSDQVGRATSSAGWRRRDLLTLVAIAVWFLVAASASATSPSFTLSPPSPSLPGIPAGPADVLNPAVPPVPAPMPPPVIGIPAAVLGLVPGDVVTGLSYGLLPPGPAPGLQVLFSVDPVSVGIPAIPPPANVACEAAGGQAQGDVFVSFPFGPPAPPNVLSLDGNGAADSPCGPPPASGLGLIEPLADDILSLEMCPASFVYSGGVLTAPIYITLGPGSPTLIGLGAGSGDILIVPPPAGPPAIFIPAPALGLVPGPPGCGAPVCDQIDDFDFGFGVALFSIAPGSPSVAGCLWSPADVLAGVGGPCGAGVISPAPASGLFPADNIDALAINFDGDADFVADPCDNCPVVPNNDQLDGDSDGVGDACDPCVGFPNVDADLDSLCDTSDPCPADPTNTCCPATPDACTGGFAKGLLIVKETVGYEKLIAKFIKGPLINQTDFGDPLGGGGTAYSLCIYDDTPSLVSEVVVDRAGDANCSGGAAVCWKALGGAPPGGKGYKYKDKDRTSDGTSLILLKGGPSSAGKSKIILKGSSILLPLPIAPLLTTTTNVTIQLRGDDAPGSGCWTATLSDVKTQTATAFKAK